MAIRRIELSYPGESRDEVLTFVSDTRVNNNLSTIYDTVSIFEKEIFPSIGRRLKKKNIKQRFELSKVLNIHDADGIRDLYQVRKMAEDINTGRHILCFGTPNIKLAESIDHQLLLFDGHHSALAYMACGKRYIEEVPYLMITDRHKGGIDNRDITVFFGEHARAMADFDWKEKVINWQADRDKQLCKRVQRNMGELFDALKERMQTI